jgi:4-amino-4-deoxy-L-arabinose transferase-like glycosyltransferase
VTNPFNLPGGLRGSVADALGPVRSTTLARWLLVPAGVVLALAGAAVTEMHRRQTHGVGSPPLVSWILFALAAAALTLSSGRRARLSLAASPPISALLRAAGRPAAIAAFSGALLCSVVSVPLFVRLNDSGSAAEAGWAANNASWLLYAASLVCFFVGVLLCRRSGDTAAIEPTRRGWPATLPRRTELAIVTALTCTALALRLPALQTIPRGLWLDEAQNGIVGTGLVGHGALHQVFVAGLTQMGALYYYALGAVVDVVGHSIWGLRVLPALAGSLTAPLLYLLASRLYGWRTGLAGGALLAFSSWSITFSRFGMASMVAVAFDVAIVLCVVVGLRSARLWAYAAGGIMLGLNMQGYFLARLLPIVLLLLALHLTVGSPRDVWRLRSGIAVFVTAAVLAFLPMGLFAVQHPAEFQSRPSTVSIFSSEGSGGQSNAVWKSLRAHALMFNYSGDRNGRHNLPGTPMLDWLTAALFFAGLGVCLLRLRRWEYFLPVVWLAAELSGGVFTYLGEAPQSHRTLENAVIAPLIAAIFFGEAWGVLESTTRFRRALTLVAGVTAAGAIAWAGFMNVDKYFGRQVNDPVVWSDMGADKVELGRLLRDNSDRNTVWVSGPLVGQPSLQFLAPAAHPLPWFGEDQLPFVTKRGRGVLLALETRDWMDMAAVARVYPDAKFEVFRARNGTPLLYAVSVSARDVAATRGVVDLSRAEPRRRATFSATGPRSEQMRLVATIRVPYFSDYRFRWQGQRARSARIRIDGKRLAVGAARPLAAGLHVVEVDVRGERGKTALLWATPRSRFRPIGTAVTFDPKRVRPAGVEGYYRRGSDFRGRAQLVRRDPLLGIYFQQIPLGPPFTVDWRGEIYAPVAGSYLLGTQQVDTARLFVDGRMLLANAEPLVLHTAPIRLTAGWHRIRLLYRALTSSYQAYLYWQPPGRPTSVVPSAFLRPSPSAFPAPVTPTLSESTGELPPGRLLDGRWER